MHKCAKQPIRLVRLEFPTSALRYNAILVFMRHH